MKSRITIILLLSLMLTSKMLHAQTPDPDSLFTLSRKAAFDNKDYRTSISYAQQALSLAPGYTDVRVFLSRVYLWNNQVDSARIESARALELDSTHEDAAINAARIAYQQKDITTAYDISAAGIKHHPRSVPLLLLMANVAIDLNSPVLGITLLDSVAKLDPTNAAIRPLLARLRDYRTPNRIGVSYTYTSFSKQFDDPWSLVNVEYTRRTSFGPMTGRVNFANRFRQDGLQFEVESYPQLSKKMYAYVGAAFSADSAVFPNWRGGASLFVNLDKAWEIDAGARYLQFYGHDNWVLTAAVGKYIKNYWLSLRSYVTVSQDEKPVVIALNTRRYLKGPDHFIGLNLSSGISPDNRSQVILLGTKNKLRTQQAELMYRLSFGMNAIQLGAGYARIEYLKDTYNDQFTGHVSYFRRF